MKDEIIDLVGIEAIKQYNPSLRLVTYYDKEHNVMYEFLTNNFDLSAKTIADIYKSRRLVETFFKWIKGHLKIKSFL
jgi:IS4 transposase